ncbi:MAG TPA: tetratricopeptide repeat protein, partial [bacterium]
MPVLRWIACLLLGAALAALPVAHAQSPDAEARYKQATTSFLQTRNTPGATPQAWRAVATEFQRVNELVPRQPRGADALFSMGLALREAFRAGGSPSDLSAAQGAFERFAAENPHHRLADDALMHVADILEHDKRDIAAAVATYRKVADTYPDGDLRDLAQQRLKALRATTPTPTPVTAPAKPRVEPKPKVEAKAQPAPAPIAP